MGPGVIAPDRAKNDRAWLHTLPVLDGACYPNESAPIHSGRVVGHACVCTVKEFICVSCWSTFRVEEASLRGATTVTCTLCGETQPVRATSEFQMPGHVGANQEPASDDVDEGAATLEMELPQDLLDELQDSLGLSIPDPGQPIARAPWVDTEPNDEMAATQEVPFEDEDFAPVRDTGLAPPDPDATTSEEIPLMEEVLQGPVSAPPPWGPEASAVPAPPVRIVETPVPGPPIEEPPPPPWEAGGAQVAAEGFEDLPPPPPLPDGAMEPVSDADADAAVLIRQDANQTPSPTGQDVWRMRLRSGLVLTFPTFKLVSAWAKDKPPTEVSIGFSDSPFVPYVHFLQALRTRNDPVRALYAVAHATDPNVPRTTEQPDRDEAEGDPWASAAAAAAAARRSATRDKLQPATYEFRKNPQKAKKIWPLVVGIAVVVLAAAGVVVFLVMSE